MRMMTTEARQPSFAGQRTLAGSQRKVVVEQVRSRRTVRRRRYHKYRKDFTERLSGTEIGEIAAWLKDAGVFPLMAIHANVFRQPRGDFGRIHDGRIYRG